MERGVLGFVYEGSDTAAVSYYGGPRSLYAVDSRGGVLSVTDPRDGRAVTVRLR